MTSPNNSSESSIEILNIELIYPLPNEQKIITISIPSPCTVNQAIIQSNILSQYPEIDLSKQKVGIFSQVCALSTLLHNDDRIEIYRPLIIDPKEARKNRALKQK